MNDKLTVALAGNPNCGKTTLFNTLTGARHSVGNWPGVTVEKKMGTVKHSEVEITIVDLPGIYSLSPYSIEEKVSRSYIVDENPDVVISIVDASNIERNLYLTMQLIELGKPVIVALNMMDVAESRGYRIDCLKLAQQLGVPVIPMVATKKKGKQELIQTIVDIAQGRLVYTPNHINFSKEIEQRINQTIDLIKHKEDITKYNLRWLAIKILEEDEVILAQLHMEPQESVEESAAIEEDDLTDDFESLIADAIYTYIGKVIAKAVKRPQEKIVTTSDRVDKILTNKWLGLPIFAGMMYLVFWFTFNVGGFFLDLIDGWFGALGESVTVSLESIGVAGWLQSLLVDGIIGGIGGVLVFLPNIAFLFMALALLEDSGYMARVAFIMDRAMKKIGLSGKAFIPMLMGFGCTVPAVMGARTLENENDRLLTMLVTPFMSCGARLPIYILFAGVFFPGKEDLVVWSLYLLGIVIAIITSLIFKKTIFKGDVAPFVMELPPYRLPSFNVTGGLVWERVKGYITKAGTVIFAASIIIWFMLGFNLQGMAEMNQSIGAGFGRLIAPIFEPLGFGSWQAALALFTGLLAKEAVVGSMAIIFGLGNVVGEAALAGNVSGFVQTLQAVGFSSLSAYAFMAFALLYTPCIAAVATIKKETNSWKWTGFSVVYQLVVAWVVALLIFQIGSIFGL